MKGWTNDDRMMIACCNDGTRPVIFQIERIDIPESEEEKEWLKKQSFKNSAENAYTGYAPKRIVDELTDIIGSIDGMSLNATVSK